MCPALDNEAVQRRMTVRTRRLAHWHISLEFQVTSVVPLAFGEFLDDIFFLSFNLFSEITRYHAIYLFLSFLQLLLFLLSFKFIAFIFLIVIVE